MTDHAALARRWWAASIWDSWVGRKVRFARTVRRDDFVVRRGSTGIVAPWFLDSNGGLVLAVKLNTPPTGAEAFEGEVHWREGVNMLDVEADLRLA